VWYWYSIWTLLSWQLSHNKHKDTRKGLWPCLHLESMSVWSDRKWSNGVHLFRNTEIVRSACDRITFAVRDSLLVCQSFTMLKRGLKLFPAVTAWSKHAFISLHFLSLSDINMRWHKSTWNTNTTITVWCMKVMMKPETPPPSTWNLIRPITRDLRLETTRCKQHSVSSDQTTRDWGVNQFYTANSTHRNFVSYTKLDVHLPGKLFWPQNKWQFSKL